MKYRIVILKRVKKEIADLPIGVYERVKSIIFNLSYNPRPFGCAKLKNRMGWRIRARNYRIIYEIDDKLKVVTILNVRHRRDVYR